METDAKEIVRSICEHHGVAPGKVAALFVEHVISNERTLMRLIDKSEADESLKSTAEMMNAMTAQAEAFAIGMLIGAAESQRPEAEKPSRRLRRATAFAAIVRAARAAGQHLADAEAVDGDGRR